MAIMVLSSAMQSTVNINASVMVNSLRPEGYSGSTDMVVAEGFAEAVQLTASLGACGLSSLGNASPDRKTPK